MARGSFSSLSRPRPAPICALGDGPISTPDSGTLLHPPSPLSSGGVRILYPSSSSPSDRSPEARITPEPPAPIPISNLIPLPFRFLMAQKPPPDLSPPGQHRQSQLASPQPSQEPMFPLPLSLRRLVFRSVGFEAELLEQRR
jgi:hypothetical protein